MSQSSWTKRIALLSLSLSLTGQIAYGQSATPLSVTGSHTAGAVNSTALTLSGPTASAPTNSSHAVTTTTTAGQGSLNLDLSSVTANLNPGHLVSSTPVSIHVGNSVQNVTGTSMLTPAELLAVYQVVKTGNQSILLGDSGNAIGGSLNIGAHFSNYVSSLVIPHGVTAIDNIANSANLNLSGNLTNNGNFYAISTNPAVTTATVSANNIYNNQGALITTVVPPGGLSGYSNLVGNVNLNLNATNNLVNSGIISSAGNLTVNAGGSISNVLPAGVTAPAPQMVAAQDVNLFTGSGQLINSGLIQAANAVNIGTLNAATDLSILNTHGTIQALGSLNSSTGVLEGGTINIREQG
ncbi:MAG: hypothetical protein K2X81_20550, partial [Candidatus Obscuribacterales bacterium]|nr:hypothetical protein [Candidatus Obscuribacterales bacterium]